MSEQSISICHVNLSMPFFTTLFLFYIAFQIQGIELKVWIILDITTNSPNEESILYGFNTLSRMEDLAHNPWIET